MKFENKNGYTFVVQPFCFLVAGTGLEPVTFGLWARRATYCSIPRYETKVQTKDDTFQVYSTLILAHLQVLKNQKIDKKKAAQMSGF